MNSIFGALHLIFNTSLHSFIIKGNKWWLVHIQIPGSQLGSAPAEIPGSHWCCSWSTTSKKKCWAVPTVLWAAGLIKQNSWWWGARCLKTSVLSSSLHLGHGRASRLTGSRSRQGPEAPTGGSHRWFVAVFAGCSVSSTISWFSRAEPAARVAAIRSNTMALPLLYFTFLLSARI